MHYKRIVRWPSFSSEDALHGGRWESIGAEAVDGFGREGDDRGKVCKSMCCSAKSWISFGAGDYRRFRRRDRGRKRDGRGIKWENAGRHCSQFCWWAEISRYSVQFLSQRSKHTLRRTEVNWGKVFLFAFWATKSAKIQKLSNLSESILSTNLKDGFYWKLLTRNANQLPKT